MDFGSELKKYLNESRGVVDGYEPIIEEIYSLIKDKKPILIGDGHYLYSVNNYDLNYDCFIKNLTVQIHFGNNINDIDGKFNYDRNSVILNENNKLINCKFTFNFNAEHNKLNYKLFSHYFAHELHHAYTYYNILINNSNTIPNKEYIKKLKYHYNNEIMRSIKPNDTIESYLTQRICLLNYLCDKEEIQANETMLYDFLKKNQHITRDNIDKYIEQLPGTEYYLSIRKIMKMINNLVNTHENIMLNIIKQNYDDINGTDINARKALSILRQKAAKALTRYRRNYFRVIGLVFDKIDFKNEVMKSNQDKSAIMEFLDIMKMEILLNEKELKF